MRRVRSALLPALSGLLLLLALPACRTAAPRAPLPDGLHPKLALTSFYEEGKLVFASVDTAAAQLEDTKTLLPLAFVLANKSEHMLRIEQERITLVDARGRRFPLASYGEFRASGAAVDLEMRASRQFFGVVAQRLHLGRVSNYRLHPLSFYGFDASAATSLTLGPHEYVRGMVYFPLPAATLKGQKLELWIESDDLPDPVFIRFAY